MLRQETTPRLAYALLAAVGAACAFLVIEGNPGNMGICGACFLRDTGGALGLFAKGPKIFRPELLGIVFALMDRGGWSGLVPVANGLGEEALPPVSDPAGFETVVEHDGGAKRRKMNVREIGNLRFRCPALDRGAVDTIFLGDVFGAPKAHAKRSEAPFAGLVERGFPGASQVHGRMRILAGFRVNWARRDF